MGRLLDAAVEADPTYGVLKLPQPFRMVDKILSGIVDDAADRAVAREQRRLARLGIVEGTRLFYPEVETAELAAAATCVCLASVSGEDGGVDELNDPFDDDNGGPASPTSDVEKTKQVKCVVFAGNETGDVLAVDAATGAVLGSASAFPGQAVVAITAVTVVPPPPEDDKFWHPKQPVTEDAAESDGETGEGEMAGDDKADDDTNAEDDTKSDDDTALPLFDIAAAAGGPTPRDATPVMVVACACDDAFRAHVFDPLSKRMWIPLCAHPTPEGSVPTTLRLSPDGRTLALGAGGGALAVYELPQPTPSTFLPNGDEDDDETSSPVEGDEAKDREEGNEQENAEGGDQGDAIADNSAHDASFFATATPLVWLTAARAVEAFGVEPVEAEVSSSQSIAEGKGEEGTSGDAEGEATPDAEDPDAETDPKEENEGTDDDQNASTNRSSGAPDLHWRLTGSKADALIVAWRGCNRAAMFSVSGRLDALEVAQHRHDAIPALWGESDEKDGTETAEDGDAGAPTDDAADGEATNLVDRNSILSSAKYSTPACDWTTPFPITASAASESGSRFALGLIDGTVLVFDARLATTCATLDRLSAVKQRTTETPIDADVSVSSSQANDFIDDESISVGSLTPYVALAFRKENGKMQLAAASAEGWTATFDLDGGDSKRALKILQPRGDPHVARAMMCQRDGEFGIVEGDAPDTRRLRVDAESGAEGWDEDEDTFEDEFDDEETDDQPNKKAKKTFVRLLDMTGLVDLYGVLSPPEACDFKCGVSGGTTACFNGRGTVVLVASERREVIVELVEEPPVAEEGEPAEESNEDADDKTEGEVEGDAEGEGENVESGPQPPAVTHTVHTKLCVYRVPLKSSQSSRPLTPDINTSFLETGSVFSDLVSLEKPTTTLKNEMSLSREEKAQARLHRVLNVRGGAEARAERFTKRLMELERKFERQAMSEGGRPAAALLVSR